MHSTKSQRFWLAFCRFMVRVFYGRFEVSGLDNLPSEGAVILVANHVNALADAVVVQASLERPVHPVARAGLFKNPVLRPILSLIQAVPIARRKPLPTASDGEATDHAQDAEARREANEAAFSTLFEYLEDDRAVLIFPEGQSHSDPSLRPIKTGAARMVLGHRRRTGEEPAVIPVGLTFTHKGRFRSSVLVQIGEPVRFQWSASDDDEQTVRRHTVDIVAALRRVTLNIDSWQDLDLMRLMQDFFALRSGADARPTLTDRFRSFKRLIEAHRALRERWPDKVEALRLKLERFAELRERYGINDYQLNLRYRPGLVTRFLLRALLVLLVVSPLALWGLLNSGVPFVLTRAATIWTAKGRDQYDSAGMLFGIVFFGFFWGLQIAFVAWRWSLWPTAALYALSLPFASALALYVGNERNRILEEARVFLLFMQRRELRAYLTHKREELEVELAQMARLAGKAKANMQDDVAWTDEASWVVELG